MRYYFSLVLLFAAWQPATAQNNSADSAQVAKTLKEIFTACLAFDFTDPKVQEMGPFYKAAPYILYRGEDKSRSWKDFANYKNPDERKGVNEVCERINGTVNRDKNFIITKYFTETESEGTWHVLMVTYDKKGVTKKAAFAFLKIGDKFGLGDID